MKKALALVLALVLALSLGVSAFAYVVVLDPKAATKDYTKYVIDVDEDIDAIIATPTDDDKFYLVAPEGGTFYFQLQGAKNLKKGSFTVETTGGLTAEVLAWDGAKMWDEDIWYSYKVKASETTYTMAELNASITDAAKAEFSDASSTDKVPQNLDEYNYELAKMIVKKAKDKGLKLEIVENSTATADKQDIYMLKVVVPANYGVAYTTGKVTVKAKDLKSEATETAIFGVKKTSKYNDVQFKLTFVTDVVIFEYETVKAAGEDEDTLVVGEDGYSDYRTDGQYGIDYDPYYVGAYASVISTTGFRALRENGWGIEVESAGMTVSIPEIGAAQKGVNFLGYSKGVSDMGHKLAVATLTDHSQIVWADKGWKDYNEDECDALAALKFGFYGKQVIASDFTIEADLGVSYYELRELFGLKMEEEDIVTYYILKDGKLYDSFTYDYLNVDDASDDVCIVINGVAGSTLGEYTIQLTAPAAEEEENPNTGAETVVGVVAALAVVSLASAAAISLKK